MIEYRKGPSQKAPRPLSLVDVAALPDLDDLVVFLHEMLAEIDGGKADETVLVKLADALVRREGGTALIVRGKTRIEASIGLKLETPLLSAQHRLRVAWNCVLPEARVTGHAKSLLIRAREVADSLGREIVLEESSPDMESGKVKLARRHLSPSGTVFLYSPAAI